MVIQPEEYDTCDSVEEIYNDGDTGKTLREGENGDIKAPLPVDNQLPVVTEGQGYPNLAMVETRM